VSEFHDDPLGPSRQALALPRDATIGGLANTPRGAPITGRTTKDDPYEGEASGYRRQAGDIKNAPKRLKETQRSLELLDTRPGSSGRGEGEE
jgi:hypothetical protein